MSSRHFYYDPFSDFDRLFDNAFTSRFFGPSGGTPPTESRRNFYRPRMDVHENAESNTVTALFNLAGVTPEQVNIDVNQDRLTVSGETSAPGQLRDEGEYTVRERAWGKFSRTLVLPQGTKGDDVKAKLENGLLKVTFPKVLPQQQPKRIAIE